MVLLDTCPDPRVALAEILSRYESVETQSDVLHLAHLGAKACEVAPLVFGTSVVARAVVALLAKSSSVETTRWVTSWICSATFRHKESRILFASVAMRDAIALALTTATCSDETRYLCSAICSITAGLAAARQCFGCELIVNALCASASHIADADACRWWLSAVCNVIAHHDENERLFGANIRFIDVMCIILPPFLSTPLSCQWWCATVGSVCRSHEYCRRRFLKRQGFVEVILTAATLGVADQSDGVRSAGNAWATLFLSPTFRSLHAASMPSVAESCCSLALRCSTVDAAEAVARAFCNITAGSADVKQIFAEAPDLRTSLIQLGSIMMKSGDRERIAKCLEQYCCALSNVSGAGKLQPGFVNQALFDVVIQVGHVIASFGVSSVSETCARWWCRAVQQFCVSSTAMLLITFATPESLQVMSKLGHCVVGVEPPGCCDDGTTHAANVPYLLSWCHCLRVLATNREDMIASLPLSLVMELRDAAADMSLLATSSEAVAAVSEACCSLMVTPEHAGTFADSSMRKATLRLSQYTKTPSAIRWLCTLVSLITSADAAYQELWGCDEGRDRMIAMARCLCASSLPHKTIPSAPAAHDGEGQVASTLQSAMEAWGTLVCNVTTQNLLVTTSLVAPMPTVSSVEQEWSLCRAVCELAMCSKSAACIQWLSSCICNLGYFQSNEDCQHAWTREGDVVIHSFVALGDAAAAAKDPSALLWFTRALAHVTQQPMVQRFFNHRRPCEMLAAVAVAISATKEDEVVRMYCVAMSNICSSSAINQAAVVECPFTRKSLMHLLRPITRSGTLVWWFYVMVVLQSRPTGPSWFADIHGARYLLSIVKRNLVVGEAAVSSLCTVIVFSLRNAAGMSSSVLPEARQHSASPIAVSHVAPDALDVLEAILCHFTKDVAGMSESVREWQLRGLRFVDAHRSAKQLSFLPKDTESILSLPAPIVVQKPPTPGDKRRQTTFAENVEAYARLRRQSSR
ncbi:Hypothetical protein, putative [Bodo saltans]|uniref:Uncharacterized protein n=1 Tax=Bodo saltans TaxID=75058 RepID=A0A0S4JB10_BODSA|nr:Hypothetical protein, putative [Bodo saltans]|eukprot:CUG86165.1 Hypothetical protein, putative [Bodo saltans]